VLFVIPPPVRRQAGPAAPRRANISSRPTTSRAVRRTLVHGAFYARVRGTLQVLAHMLDRGELDELHQTIAREGRQIKAITGFAPRKRRR